VSEIPEDIFAIARTLADDAANFGYTQAALDIARAILAERERCAAHLEELVEWRRQQNPKRHLGNGYILSCAGFVRRGPILNPHSLSSPIPTPDSEPPVVNTPPATGDQLP